MPTNAFRIEDGLLGAARLPALGRCDAAISGLEIAALLAAGAAAAAATGFLRLGLGIPGSSIVLAVLPFALGLALVPRRRAGLVMSASALATAAAMAGLGLTHYGPGAMTSLCLTGASLDVAVTRAPAGWRLYVRLVGAGCATNLLAFLERGASKVFGLDRPGTRLFAEWFSQALVTYVLAGALAGLIGAVCWFEFRARPAPFPRSRR